MAQLGTPESPKVYMSKADHQEWKGEEGHYPLGVNMLHRHQDAVKIPQEQVAQQCLLVDEVQSHQEQVEVLQGRVQTIHKVGNHTVNDVKIKQLPAI